MSVRTLLLTLSFVAAGVLAPAANADAAKPASKYPTIKKVEPLRLSIGDTMTITGSGFLKGPAKNTVVFRRSGKRSVFVKADGLSSTRLSLKIPAKLEQVLGVKNGAAQTTRFQINVLSKRLGRTYTPLGTSPTIVPVVAPTASTPAAEAAKIQAAAAAAAAVPVNAAPAETPPPPPDCDGDGNVDASDPDDDNDLLPDTTETSIQTNRCMADTDGDGMEDGWEYKSAIDWNNASCPDTEYPVPCSAARPYPHKRPYTNPLFVDNNLDYDGDFLRAGHEFAAWRSRGDRNLSTLWYSDGLQSSIDATPNDGCRGDVIPAPLMGRSEYTLDRHNQRTGDAGCLQDDERDADQDFLTNKEEVAAQLSRAAWWDEVYEEPPFMNVYDGTNFLDKDSDGDNVLDGIDDQDQDGFWNVEETWRGGTSAVKTTVPDGPDADSLPDEIEIQQRTGLWVNPFNPCLPAPTSEKCPRGVLLGADPWRPFYKADPSEPTKRWPLYGHDLASQPDLTAYEVWNGMAQNQQKLPPTHPLLPRPS